MTLLKTLYLQCFRVVGALLGRPRWETGALRVVARGFVVCVSTNALENTHHNRTLPRPIRHFSLGITISLFGTPQARALFA